MAQFSFVVAMKAELEVNFLKLVLTLQRPMAKQRCPGRLSALLSSPLRQ